MPAQSSCLKHVLFLTRRRAGSFREPRRPPVQPGSRCSRAHRACGTAAPRLPARGLPGVPVLLLLLLLLSGLFPSSRNPAHGPQTSCFSKDCWDEPSLNASSRNHPLIQGFAASLPSWAPGSSFSVAFLPRSPRSVTLRGGHAHEPSVRSLQL